MVGLNPDQRDLALKLGASRAVDGADPEVVHAVSGTERGVDFSTLAFAAGQGGARIPDRDERLEVAGDDDDERDRLGDGECAAHGQDRRGAGQEHEGELARDAEQQLPGDLHEQQPDRGAVLCGEDGADMAARGLGTAGRAEGLLGTGELDDPLGERAVDLGGRPVGGAADASGGPERAEQHGYAREGGEGPAGRRPTAGRARAQLQLREDALAHQPVQVPSPADVAVERGRRHAQPCRHGFHAQSAQAELATGSDDVVQVDPRGTSASHRLLPSR